jgi:hypothetical protein
VNARVGTPGKKDGSSFPANPAQSFFEFALHRAGMPLPLASEETCAVVSKDNLVTCHFQRSAKKNGGQPLFPSLSLLFHQFEQNHLSLVTEARTEFQDAGVAAIPF